MPVKVGAYKECESTWLKYKPRIQGNVLALHDA
jgi:hypothetical protein